MRYSIRDMLLVTTYVGVGIALATSVVDCATPFFVTLIATSLRQWLNIFLTPRTSSSNLEYLRLFTLVLFSCLAAQCFSENVLNELFFSLAYIFSPSPTLLITAFISAFFGEIFLSMIYKSFDVIKLKKPRKT